MTNSHQLALRVFVVTIIWFCVSLTTAFNLDIDNPLTFQQPDSGRPNTGPSYFGFSVALLRDNGYSW